MFNVFSFEQRLKKDSERESRTQQSQALVRTSFQKRKSCTRDTGRQVGKISAQLQGQSHELPQRCEFYYS